MPLPSFRNSRSKVRRRRSHHALKAVTTTACPKCETILLPHRACKKCGWYKDRSVKKGLDEVKKAIKKTVKKAKATKAADHDHKGHDHA